MQRVLEYSINSAHQIWRVGVLYSKPSQKEIEPIFLRTTSNGRVAWRRFLQVYLLQYQMSINLDIYNSHERYRPINNPIYLSASFFDLRPMARHYWGASYSTLISHICRLTGANATPRASFKSSFVITSSSLPHHPTRGATMFPWISLTITLSSWLTRYISNNHWTNRSAIEIGGALLQLNTQ